MKLDDSQKRQFIVLCCLILLVFGFGVYRLIGISTNAGTNTDKPVSVQETKPAIADETKQSELQASETKLESQPVNVTVTARDPFAPQIIPDQHNSEPSQPQRIPEIRVANAGRSIAPIFPSMDGIPPIINVGSGNSVDSTSGMTRVPEETPTKDLKLTGIIDGTIRVAIIRGTENTRYIVREGQVIGGKYTVTHISSNGVSIKYRDKDFVLRLGGNDSSENRTRS